MRHNKVGEPKLFKLFGRFSLILLLGVSYVNAESFEDFQRSQAESFQKYKDERDNEFNKYLKEQWKAYSAFSGTPLYEKPKPKIIATAKPQPIKSVGPKVIINIEPVAVVKPVQEKVLEKEIPQKQTVEKPTEKTPIVQDETQNKTTPKVVVVADIEQNTLKITTPEVTVAKVVQVPKKDVNFLFFGTKLGFNVPSNIKHANFYPQDQKGISSFFDTAASSDYEGLVADIQKVSKDMNLNDWGIYLLVTTLSDNIFSVDDNAKLLSWFLFNKMGYAVKVGIANKHVVLMHYSEKIIYSTPNYSFQKQKYYVIANYAKGSVGRLYSYDKNYPGSDKALDLSLNTLPKLAENIQSKTLSYTKLGTKFEVPMQYNKNLIDFMGTYPQADYETFFNAPMDERTYHDIAVALKKYIDGKKASEAMNFVLNFVQNAFKYQRDDQQFGREKVMFAQETLYFDKSDCEDRATLFAYLIKELFGVGVVGVKYKDHMSTALYIPMQGDSIMAGKRKFVLADPTYINANIGQEMPKYKSQIPDSFVVVKAH